MKRIILFIFGVLILTLLGLGCFLAYPSFLFEHQKTYGNWVLFSDQKIEEEVDRSIAAVKTWLAPNEIYDPNTKIHIYLCRDINQFKKIIRFTLRNEKTMGINLPELRNCFINQTMIERYGYKTGNTPAYHSREGNTAHVIAHELMHQYLYERYGSMKSRQLPVWKIEGYCEFGSNYVRIKNDTITLSERLTIFHDHSQWNETAQPLRNHYLWGMMIEYLVEWQDKSIDDIMDDSITFSAVYHEMINTFNN